LRELFGGPPDLDPCSNPYSRVGAKTEYTLEKGNDGLVDSWLFRNTYVNWLFRNIYVNPPFGKGWYKTLDDGRREYIWPSDRKAKKAELSKADFKAWIKDYKLVDIGHWIKKCADTAAGPSRSNVVGLIPSYPDTRAWHNHVWPRAQVIFFPKGRIHFRLVYSQPDGSTIEKTGPAPMACALPLWTQDPELVDRFGQVFSQHGHVQLVMAV
jgi:hypothetical protein